MESLSQTLTAVFDGVVAAAEIFVELLLGDLLFAAISHFPALIADEELHVVAVLGHIHAIMVRPAMEFENLGGCRGRDCREKMRRHGRAARGS